MRGGGVTLSSRLHNALFALFIGGILTYGAGFAWYMLARFDLINLIRDVSNDDAFYYFQIAYNLAEGRFSTFDGGITRTNGYHPLWMLLITPFYWVFDKETALFGIKAFEIMLVAGSVALVAMATRLARLSWILLFALLPILYQNHALFKGMEAAAALFMLGMLFFSLVLFARHPMRWKWLLAAVTFALPWVRLEYVAISLAATAALCLIEWSWQDHPPGTSFRARVRSIPSLKAVVPFLTACAGILAYFAYNGLAFGGIMPVSGAVKQFWSSSLWEQEGGYSLTQSLQETLQTGFFDLELLVALEVCAYLLLVWWFARGSRSRQDWLLLAFLVGVFGLASGHLAKFAQIVLAIHPYWGSHTWYFVPAYLLMMLIVPVRCYVAIHFIRRFIRPRSHRVANALNLSIIIVGAVFLFAKAEFPRPFRSVDWQSETTSRNWTVTYHMNTLVMNRLLPEDSVIGSWDAGIIGYFSRFPVVNLDGLVNSYDYMHALKEGTMATFYQRYGITHFANAKSVGRGVDGTILFESPLFFLNGKGKKFTLWSAEPREASADGPNRSVWFWERMAAHFDYQSAGVRFLVDGRLVQAFARECDPNELAVWSWAGQENEAVVNSWMQTQTGLCVDTLLLPHNALPPVRVETMPASDYVARLVGDRQPAISANFDVYLVENSLVYVKEQCSPEDVEPTFFLHLKPVDANDLPSYREQYGFDNLDFAFRNHSVIEGGVCVAKRELPDYGIATVRTGQSTGEGRVWQGRFDIPL